MTIGRADAAGGSCRDNWRNGTRVGAETPTTLPYSAVIAPAMRKTIAAVAILVALCLAYIVWPFASLASVVRAARAGDLATIERRVDWPALRRSLAGQIVTTYARLNGIRLDRAGLTVGAVTSFMDPFIEKLTLPENIGALMRSGWPSGMLSDAPTDIEGIDPDLIANAWQLYLNSDYGIGEVRTTVPFHQPRDKQFRVELALDGLTWKLSGLELPVALQERLTRELMKQQGKAG
jgi:hypothetical protein